MSSTRNSNYQDATVFDIIATMKITISSSSSIQFTKSTAYLFDCVISCGERDPKCYGKYLRNVHHKFEVVKHGVSEQEAKDWYGSAECMKRVHELEAYGKQVFGNDHWMKWSVSYFWTTSSKD